MNSPLAARASLPSASAPLSDLPQDRLRPLAEADLAQVLEWRNAPSVRAMMYKHHPISLPEHLAWFARLQQDPTRAAWVFEAHGVPGGIVNFTRIDRAEAHAHWGFYVRPDAPRGYGTRLGRLALAQAFGPLALSKLCGEVLAWNQASLAFHLKLGFAQEDVLRAHHRDGEQFHDVHVFGLSRETWTREHDAATIEDTSSGETP
jgi:UDP-4-amino-4,6-dideoxy-N-acetyl-beta-L-altrosamine N-acetyltransferase